MSSEWVNAIGAALGVLAFIWCFNFVLRYCYTAAKNMELAAMERERAIRHSSVARDVAELRQHRYRVYEPKTGELVCRQSVADAIPGAVPHQIDTWQNVCTVCGRTVRDIRAGYVGLPVAPLVSQPAPCEEHRSITLRRSPNAQ